MKLFKRYIKRLKCKHHYIPEYVMYVHGGTDKVYVSKCRCGKYQYRNLKKVMKEGRVRRK